MNKALEEMKPTETRKFCKEFRVKNQNGIFRFTITSDSGSIYMTIFS